MAMQVHAVLRTKKRTISKVVPEYRIIPEIINAVILTVNLHI